MRLITNPLILAAISAAAACAQQNPVLGEDTTKISDHVRAIMGFPNIAIIVGTRATLVVDTGLGPRNGATIARVAAKLSAPNAKPPGDGSLVTQERVFIADLRSRALELKKRGVTSDDAGKQLSDEFKAKYSGWPNMNVAGFVKSVYAE